MSILSEPHFPKEEAACERLDVILWPKGPRCRPPEGRDCCVIPRQPWRARR